MTKPQKLIIWRMGGAVLLTAGCCLLKTTGWVRLVSFIIPYLLVGYDVLWDAVTSIVRLQPFDEKFLMSIATIGAFVTGDYTEAVAVMIFYQVGELFSDLAVGKSRRSIAKLMDIRPDCSVVLRDGQQLTVSPDEVRVGETIVVRPGERVPLDGRIISGETTLNTSALTGESLPVEAREGDAAISGSINLSGTITLVTTSSFAESTVSKILELVENASDKKARAESFITRFARIYTPCVVAAAVLLALIPPLAFGQDYSVWLSRALIFLVVSCPCALVVSVPLSFFGGIGGASRSGILIKGANYLEALSKVRTVVFDKTGTLTKGNFVVDAIHPHLVTEAQLLDIAAAAESYSVHPVAESIITAHGGHIDRARIGATTERAGMGVEAVIDGERYFVGNGKLMDLAGADWHECHLSGTTVHISRDDNYLGHIVINDQIKPNAARAVSELHELGIRHTVMLTGDNERSARAVGEAVGVDEIRSGLYPADKVAAVEELLPTANGLAFVGDGINDAPVLARADVGVAMGALGSDAAIEAADIVLMDDKPEKLPLAISISRKTMRIVKQNIVFTLAVKGVILVLSAMGLTNMWIAVFGDVGVMVIAILNSMRAMRKAE